MSPCPCARERAHNAREKERTRGVPISARVWLWEWDTAMNARVGKWVKWPGLWRGRVVHRAHTPHGHTPELPPSTFLPKEMISVFLRQTRTKHTRVVTCQQHSLSRFAWRHLVRALQYLHLDLRLAGTARSMAGSLCVTHSLSYKAVILSSNVPSMGTSAARCSADKSTDTSVSTRLSSSLAIKFFVGTKVLHKSGLCKMSQSFEFSNLFVWRGSKLVFDLLDLFHHGEREFRGWRISWRRWWRGRP